MMKGRGKLVSPPQKASTGIAIPYQHAPRMRPRFYARAWFSWRCIFVASESEITINIRRLNLCAHHVVSTYAGLITSVNFAASAVIHSRRPNWSLAEWHDCALRRPNGASTPFDDAWSAPLAKTFPHRRHSYRKRAPHCNPSLEALFIYI